MKYLYLKFRVWRSRRRLHRRLKKLGLLEAADQTSALSLPCLQKNTPNKLRRILHWLKIGLTLVGIAVWLIFCLRTVQPVRISVPPPEKPFQP